MANMERIARILNAYRDEIRAKSPKSFSTWQKNRTVMPAGVGSLFRLADPFPMVVKRAKGVRRVVKHDSLPFLGSHGIYHADEAHSNTSLEYLDVAGYFDRFISNSFSGEMHRFLEGSQ